MALAGLMSRNKRKRKKELDLKLSKLEQSYSPQSGMPVVRLGRKEAEEAQQIKAAQEAIRKILQGKELLYPKSQSSTKPPQFPRRSDEDPHSRGGSTCSLINFGLMFIVLGGVFVFVGIGQKGYKTLHLKLVGPTIILLGLACFVLKIIYCAFPTLFKVHCRFGKLCTRKRGKLRDSSEDSNEKEECFQNGNTEEGPRSNSQNQLPNRVTLQSQNNVAPSRATIPESIESLTDEEGFDVIAPH